MAVLATLISTHEQFGMHAALPVEAKMMSRWLVAAVDNDFMQNGTQDPLSHLRRGRRMIPEFREIDAQFEQALSIVVCKRGSLGVHISQSFFEFAYLP